jgi:hypothetical protein
MFSQKQWKFDGETAHGTVEMAADLIFEGNGEGVSAVLPRIERGSALFAYFCKIQEMNTFTQIKRTTRFSFMIYQQVQNEAN